MILFTRLHHTIYDHQESLELKLENKLETISAHEIYFQFFFFEQSLFLKQLQVTKLWYTI